MDKRKNIEKLKKQFLRCRATKDEQIDAVVELLSEMFQREKHYNRIYNKLDRIGVLALKIDPKISKKCYTSHIRAALSAIKNTALLFFYLPRDCEKIIQFYKLTDLWENLHKISQNLLAEKGAKR
jgi:hypothetical protein